MSRFLKSRTATCFNGRVKLTFKPNTLGVLVEADEFVAEFEALIADYNVKPETKRALQSVASEFATLLVSTMTAEVLAPLSEVEDAFVQWLTELDLDETDFAELWAARMEMPDTLMTEWSSAYLAAQQLNADSASAPTETLPESDKRALADAQSPLV